MSDTDIQPNENDKYPSIVDFAIDANPTGIATTFDQQIKDVIASKLDDRKVELGQEMFNLGYQADNDNEPEEDKEPEVETDEDDLTDDEINQLSDEEWQELITQLETEDESIETND